MPNYLHRTSKEYLVSVSPVSLLEPAANYIMDPDLSAVAGQPSIYWTITGDIVTLMNQAARDAVDVALAAALQVERRGLASGVPDSVGNLGIQIRALIELFNKRDNYLVTRVEELQGALDVVKASSGGADNIRAAIPASWLATATRAKGVAVQAYKDDIDAGNQDI